MFTVGLDAPPLNDDNHNGVPGYVEQSGAAADAAFAYYSAHGFRAPRRAERQARRVRQALRQL